MKNVIILYMPGQAGNFIARLFSLGTETMPLLKKSTLQYHLESVTDVPEDFDRVENYRFSTASEFDDWQLFHRSYADHKDRASYHLLNIYCGQKYSRIVFPIHPHEFKADFDTQSDSESYFVDLDLDTWGDWVHQQQKKLHFRYRHNEWQQFDDLKVNMQPISLTKMLQDQDCFLTEYHRVCDIMFINPLPSQALRLRQDWLSIRL